MSARPRRSATPTPATNRYAALKANLEERKRTLQAEIRMRLTVVRESHADADHKAGFDDADTANAELQGDLDLALTQMKVESLTLINAALQHLETDSYGVCVDCGDEISEARLRALPFAARCVECEQAREQRQPATRRAPLHFGRGE